MPTVACGTTAIDEAPSAATPGEQQPSPSDGSTPTNVSDPTTPLVASSGSLASDDAGSGTGTDPSMPGDNGSPPSTNNTAHLTSGVGAATGTPPDDGGNTDEVDGDNADDREPTVGGPTTNRDRTGNGDRGDDRDRTDDGNSDRGAEGDDRDGAVGGDDGDGNGGGQGGGEEDLPGERVNGFGPQPGRELGVFGVAHDEMLPVRARPGSDGRVVIELAPLADGVLATGHTRRLPDRSIWHEVQTNGESGWVPAGSVFYLGSTVDLTSFVVRRNGRYPTADSVAELAGAVADVLTRSGSTQHTTVVAPSSSSDSLSEVVIDVRNPGNDSLWGRRLRVVATEARSGDGYTLHQVVATDFCLRGVARSGRCT